MPLEQLLPLWQHYSCSYYKITKPYEMLTVSDNKTLALCSLPIMDTALIKQLSPNIRTLPFNNHFCFSLLTEDNQLQAQCWHLQFTEVFKLFGTTRCWKQKQNHTRNRGEEAAMLRALWFCLVSVGWGHSSSSQCAPPTRGSKVLQCS